MADTTPITQEEADQFADFQAMTHDIPAVAEDEFDGFQAAESTPQEKLVAVGQGAVGGAAVAGPMLAGMTAGVLATAAIPVPGARVAGGIIGAGIGMFAGGELREAASTVNVPGTDVPLTRPSIESFPPDQRAFAIGGEVFGGGGPFVGGTLALGRSGFRFGKSFVGSWGNRVLDAAKNTPGTFLAAEVSGLTGAATGGAAAEVIAPGRGGVRFSAELMGGFLNPTRVVTSTSTLVRNKVTGFLNSFKKEGRQIRAGQTLEDILTEAGEDVQLLSKLLDDAGIPGIGPQTAAQKTGSDALAVLEAQLATLDGKFSAEAKKLTEANFNSIDKMITVLRGSGDPKALPVAAELQALKFKALLDGRVQAAERELAEHVARITKDTPAAREELSRQANEALSTALSESRTAETALWSQIDDKVQLVGDAGAGGADSTLAEISRMRADLLPEEKLPEIIAGFSRRANKLEKKIAKGEDIDPKENITAGELMKLRSRSLALARDAQAQGNFNDARIYGNIAESVLDDLDNAFGADEAYTMARSFSRELNDTFTRTFAGQAMSKGPRGVDRVPPELMLSRALGTGKEAGAMRLRELDEATRFMLTKGLDDSANIEKIVDAMLDAQDRLVRLAAADSIDPNTGRIGAKQLGSFIRNNGSLLRRFPKVKADLDAALKSELKLQDVTRSITGESRVTTRMNALAKVAKVENSVTVVKAAVRGNNPERDLGVLAKLAKGGGDETVQGLRSSMFDHAIIEASSVDGRLNYKMLRASLFDDISPGQPSVVAIMQKAGILDDASVKQLTKLLDEADKIERVVATSGRPDEGFLGEVDALTDLLTRAGGSFGATQAAKAVGISGAGSSLVIAGAGSRTARRALDKVPQGKIRDVLIEAATVPEFMAMLLRKPKTPKAKFELNQQLHAYIIQAGLAVAKDPVTEEPAHDTRIAP